MGMPLAWAVVDQVPVAELLARACEGDRKAWETIVDRYYRLVWSVVRGYRLDSESAADVSQTVWEKLITHADRIRDPERLGSWLATTAKHESLRLLGRQRRQVPVDEIAEQADLTAMPIEELLIDQESTRSVYRAFRQLPEESQRVLRLLTVDPPLDYETIGELIGRPVGSIGPTRQRILKKLKALMEEDARRGTRD